MANVVLKYRKSGNGRIWPPDFVSRSPIRSDTPQPYELAVTEDNRAKLEWVLSDGQVTAWYEPSQGDKTLDEILSEQASPKSDAKAPKKAEAKSDDQQVEDEDESAADDENAADSDESDDKDGEQAKSSKSKAKTGRRTNK